MTVKRSFLLVLFTFILGGLIPSNMLHAAQSADKLTLLQQSPVFVFVGPSSSGKSTLLENIRQTMSSTLLIALDDISDRALEKYESQRGKKADKVVDKDNVFRNISGENFAIVQETVKNLKTQNEPHVVLCDTCLGTQENPVHIKTLLNAAGVPHVYIIYTYCPLRENIQRVRERNEQDRDEEKRSPEQVIEFYGTYLKGLSPEDSHAQDCNFDDQESPPRLYGRFPTLGETSQKELWEIVQSNTPTKMQDRQFSRICHDLLDETGDDFCRTTPQKQLDKNDSTPVILVPRFRYDFIVNTTKDDSVESVTQFISEKCSQIPTDK